MATAAKAPTTFYEELVAEVEARNAQSPSDRASFFNRPMSDEELVEFLCFQAYYERRAAEFIASWLPKTPERDAFVMLAQQVEDEANHYEYHMRSLAKRGVTSLDNWKLEPEWEEWIDAWYPTGADTIERVAAHNVTGEWGAYQAFTEIKERLPDDVQRSFERIIPDEQFHMKLGRKVLEKYCVTAEQQGRVRERVMRTLELQENARAAFNRRMTQLGLADPGDPTPELG
jgi:1,2-phenylacetyl-CoA epoxidase catalytic subunit